MIRNLLKLIRIKDDDVIGFASERELLFGFNTMYFNWPFLIKFYILPRNATMKMLLKTCKNQQRKRKAIVRVVPITNEIILLDENFPTCSVLL